MVVCCLYSNEKKAEWDSFVESCKTPLFFFKRDFIEYHADRFNDSSLMFYKDNVLVSVLPASNDNEILVSHGGLTYGGMLLSIKVRAEVVSEIFSILVEKAVELGFKKLIYKATPHIFHKHGAQEDMYFLFNKLEGKIYRRDLSSYISLANRIKLSKGRKWLTARAKKLGLEVTESSSWDSFHELLSNVLDKHGVKPVHTAKELKYLADLFPNNIELKVVEPEGVMIAAALLFKFDGVVHTQYLAANDQGRESGALDFLIENSIKESQEKGFTYFSFGTSTEQQGKVLNVGLAAQKESFGARGLVLDFYEVEFN